MQLLTIIIWEFYMSEAKMPYLKNPLKKNLSLTERTGLQ